MELFKEDGCLSGEGLRALVGGELGELERLEAAEHLAYCDKCVDRYTALLTQDALKTPQRSVKGAVMGTVWVRVMQNTWGRSAVAAAAAVLALTMWRGGAFENLALAGSAFAAMLPSSQSVQEERAETPPERLGKPYEGNRARQLYYELRSGAQDAAGTPTDTTADGGEN